MTLAQKTESHSIEELEELTEKFDIDQQIYDEVKEETEYGKEEDFIKNVLEEAEGVYKYFYNEKFDLHQIERLEVET